MLLLIKEKECQCTKNQKIQYMLWSTTFHLDESDVGEDLLDLVALEVPDHVPADRCGAEGVEVGSFDHDAAHH